MATTTLTAAPSSRGLSRITGAMASLMVHLIASREREARRYVAAYLASMDK